MESAREAVGEVGENNPVLLACQKVKLVVNIIAYYPLIIIIVIIIVIVIVIIILIIIVIISIKQTK